MVRPPSSFPTELELEILKVIWRHGPQTVEQVREALAKGKPSRTLTHSSVITVMNIMVKKEYLERAKQGRAFAYSASVSEEDVNRGMLGDLMARAFNGSASAMMLELMETADLDDNELKEIRQMLNRKRRER